MLYEIMKHLRNYFQSGIASEGMFQIKDGTISLPYSDGCYILIEGSLKNDGVYQIPVADLEDEEFEGRISVLAIPKAFLELVADIESYAEKETVSPYQSESFGGYSYTKATTASGNIASWQNAFGTRLNAWRKV